MNNICIFLYRDFNELVNTKRFYIILIAALLPITAILPVQGVLVSRESTMRLMFLLIPIYISTETILSQTVNYIKSGIYEQYFINTRIKKYQIVIEKWLLNSIYSTISIVLSFLSIVILGKLNILEPQWIFNIFILVGVYIMSFVSATVGIIASTLIRNEKNIFLYVLLLMCILLIIFGIFQMFKFYSDVILGIYLLVIGIIGVIIVNCMFTSNRFVNRDR